MMLGKEGVKEEKKERNKVECWKEEKFSSTENGFVPVVGGLVATFLIGFSASGVVSCFGMVSDPVTQWPGGLES